jgi:beta-glucosidase
MLTYMRLSGLLLVVLLCGGALASPRRSPAVTPLAREADWWQDRHQQINREVRRRRPRVILVGDSIIYGWRFIGRPVWKRQFGRVSTLNLGMDRDQTGHVLWRLKHGNLKGLAATVKVAVLQVGVNNAAQRNQPPREIAAGIRAVVAELRRRLPRAHVLLLAILPAGRDGSAFREKISATNRLAAHIADRRWIHFLDISSRLLDGGGRLPRSVSYDRLHLTEHGYSLYATAMGPVLRRLLASPAPGSK